MSASEMQRREPRRTSETDRSRLRRILRLPAVEAVTGRKRSAIYEGVAEGTFPAPVPLGPRAVGWLEDELIDWQQEQIAARAARSEQRRMREGASHLKWKSLNEKRPRLGDLKGTFPDET
jgi:prophage regulatory protein